jgi:class 3 adenylate cyclase/DNA-binding winged helix-turn-helix (wHTH) protein/tetratricopeptide (TPR) repeat protein
MLYAFDTYTLDLADYELRQAGRLVPLEPRVFDLLAYLVQHPGRTVTTEELLEQLYPNQFAPVDRLTNAVAQARRALHDTGQTQRYIQTVRRRGYRFIASVEIQQQAGTDAQSSPAVAPPIPTEQHGLDQTDAGASPPPVQSPPPSVPPSAPDPASAPRATRPVTPEAERRQLTVLVCRLAGVSERAKRLDPEELLEVVPDYHAIGAEVVCHFDGHIAQYQGDRLVVYFGYPQAHEDDARRAVYTGLDLVERMAELNRRRTRAGGVQLAVRVGIHTGIVVVGAMGQDERAPLALGDTSTIAAQVQDLAAPDTIVIGPTTLRLVEGYFDYRVLGAYILEEPAEPLALYQILQEDTSQSRFEVTVAKGLTPLVGREQEIQFLRERWAQVKDGWGQVVLLSGEAGIGKSRLVQALKEHLTGEAHTRIACRASSYYQQSAFYPVVEHVQRLLQFRKDDTPEEKLRKLEAVLGPYGFALEEVVPLFAVLLSLPLADRYAPLALTPERQKQKTLEALLTWLLRETERQPVCFIVEDLHWVDPSTLEWLSLLIDQIPTTSMLMLLTFRPDFQPPWAVRSHLTHLTLGRLSPRQTAGMIGQVVGGKPLPAEVMQQVVATTDGVPLFVEELTKMVVELGLVKEREGRYELAGPLFPLTIPTTLHDSLMARLDRLGTAKQVAQLGSVVGREFAYEVLQAVAPVEEAILQQGLEQLVDAELLYQRGLPPQARYRFKHALIQEAAYQSLLRSTRRQYHQQIAQVLEDWFPETRETQPELLAHHYAEAGLSEQAILYWRRAGQRAIERSAHREAVVCFEQALAALKHLPKSHNMIEQAIDLRFDLRHSLMQIGELDQVFKHLRDADTLSRELGDQYRLGWVSDYMSNYFRNVGKYDEAIEAGERALTIAQQIGDFALQVAANFHLGASYQVLGDYHRGIDILRRTAISLEGDLSYERLGLPVPPSIFSREWLVFCLAELGEFAEGFRVGEEAFRIAEVANRAMDLAYTYRGIAFLYLRKGEVDKAIAMTKRGLEFCQLVDLPVISPWFITFLSYAYALAGRIAEALPLLEQAASIESAVPSFRVLNFACLSEVSLLAGRMDEAIQLAERALELSRDRKERGHEAWALRLLGEIASRYNPPEVEPAETSYRQALALAEELGMRPLMAHCHLGLGALYHQMTWLEQARSELSTAVEMYRAMEIALWLTPAQAMLALAK